MDYVVVLKTIHLILKKIKMEIIIIVNTNKYLEKHQNFIE